MSLPTPGDVHVNAPLTNLSVLFAQSLTRFAADRLFPIVTSDKESNTFFKFDKTFWARDSMKVRGLAARAAEGGFGISKDSFFCETFAIAKPIPDRVRRNSDNPLNQDRAAMRYVTTMERIRREKQFATDVLKTGVWSSDKAGVAGAPGANQFKQWNDAASTPVEDIRGFCTAVDLLTLGAARPNVFAMGQEVWDKLADHPDIVDRLKYGGQIQGTLSKVTPQMVAALMDLEEIVIMSAVEETSLETVAGTSSGAYIAGKKALLLFRQPTPMVEEVSAGYTMCWQDVGSSPEGWRIKKYRDEPIESDIVENQSSFVQKVVAADAGVFLGTVVA